MNYSKAIKNNNAKIQQLSESELLKLFQELLSNKEFVSAAAEVLKVRGQRQLEDNLVFRHKESLLSGGAHDTPEADKRRDIALIGAIQLGQVLRSIVMFHDVEAFKRGYKNNHE